VSQVYVVRREELRAGNDNSGYTDKWIISEFVAQQMQYALGEL